MFLTKKDFDSIRDIAKSFKNLYITPETLVYYLLTHEQHRMLFATFNTISSIITVSDSLKEFMLDNSHNSDDVEPKVSYAFEVLVKKSVQLSLLSNMSDVAITEVVNCIYTAQNRTFVNDLVEAENFVLNINTFEDINFDHLDQDITMNSNNSHDEVEFEKHTINLNKTVLENSNFSPSIGCDDELLDIQRIMLRKTKNSVMITGEAGVGKSNIIYTLVDRINKSQVHDDLKGKQVFELDMGSLMSDIKFHGILEARIKAIIDTLKKNKDYILFIDEIHMINGAGGNNNNLDILNFIKAPLAKNQITLIGSTTISEYNKNIAKNPTFSRRFDNVLVKEPTEDQTFTILQNRVNEFSKFYNIDIDDTILKKIVELSNMYIKSRYNPDKSIDILDSMLSRKKITSGTTVSLSDVFTEISKECNIPSDELSKNKMEMLQHMKNTLEEKVIGQENAFDSICDTLTVSYANLRDKNKTLGNFLFQGFTSTGKTETAKIIAESLGIPLIRYDMSAYQEKHTVSTLIGAPPGYIGFSDSDKGGGKLINDIERNPHCVLLLDEIEKAHKDVLNILLQIMDYGKLTSSSGKSVYFSKVIVIMTSNIGTQDAMRKTIGFHNSDNSTEVISESIKKFLSPEFRARIDSIIKFKKLDKTDMYKIITNQLVSLNSNLKEHNITLNVNDDTITYLSDESYKSELGARFIQNLISSQIMTKVAKLILENPENTTPITKNIVVENGNIIIQ